MEVYKERLIAYSLGNFATYGRFDLSGPLGVSVVLEASLDRDGRLVNGKLISTKQEGKGVPMPDAAHRGAKLVRALSLEDFPESSARIDESSFEFTP